MLLSFSNDAAGTCEATFTLPPGKYIAVRYIACKVGTERKFVEKYKKVFPALSLRARNRELYLAIVNDSSVLRVNKISLDSSTVRRAVTCGG